MREAMSESNVAIQVSGVKKRYRLGEIGNKTLRAELQSRRAKRRGMEDPNLRIGVDARLLGQEFYALNGIDLTICKGERVGIIGANGAGKSTLLKLLCRITAPTEGEIDIYGRITSMLEIGTGFHREMTGRENIFMNGAILGMSKKEIEAKLADIIAFSEIEEFIDTPVKRYSSGMFVKLAFAVAAHLTSDIMIMDEVLAVGDMAFQQKCLAKMRSAADDEGKTVLYVSHNMDTIRRLCSRCIVLDKGRVLYDGEVEGAIAVYMDHALSENSVDMELRGKGYDGSSALVLEHLTLEDKLTADYAPGEAVTLLLRLHNTKRFHSLRLRLSFRSETDMGIGTSWSQPFDLTETGEHTLRFVFPADALAKGTLYGSLGIYETDEIGRRRTLDHVTRAFKLRFSGLPVWDVSAHGYVALPETKVEGI